MTFQTCERCTAPLGSALECAYCGAQVALPAVVYHPPAADDADAGEGVALHAMSLTKLVVLSLCTLGMYSLFWIYRNWRLRNEWRGRGISAPMRTIFAPLFLPSLLNDVRDEAAAVGEEVGWSAGLLAMGYFAMNVAARLPDPLWLVSVLNFAVLVPVQRTINRANARSPRPSPVDTRFTGANWAWIVIGGLFLLLAILGTLFPET